MTEETKQAEQQPAPEEKPEDSLESLYEQYNVAKPETAPAAPPAELQPGENPLAAIQQEMAAFRQELADERQERTRTSEEADFHKAVAALGKAAELEGKDKMLRGYLIAQASDDPRLKTLWDNRNSNPRAWSRALEILGKEVKKEFDVPNPQLEENQRAMEESQRGASTVPPQKAKAEDEWMRLNPADFEQRWRRMVGGR